VCVGSTEYEGIVPFWVSRPKYSAYPAEPVFQKKHMKFVDIRVVRNFHFKKNIRSLMRSGSFEFCFCILHFWGIGLMRSFVGGWSERGLNSSHLLSVSCQSVLWKNVGVFESFNKW
jgi:hypothetical protein